MPRTYIKVEYFQYIQLMEVVTIDQFAKKFGIPRKHAAVWLSKWAGKGYLTQDPPVRMAGYVRQGRPAGGGYRLGKKWWGDLVHGSELADI